MESRSAEITCDKLLWLLGLPHGAFPSTRRLSPNSFPHRRPRCLRPRLQARPPHRPHPGPSGCVLAKLLPATSPRRPHRPGRVALSTTTFPGGRRHRAVVAAPGLNRKSSGEPGSRGILLPPTIKSASTSGPITGPPTLAQSGCSSPWKRWWIKVLGGSRAGNMASSRDSDFLGGRDPDNPDFVGEHREESPGCLDPSGLLARPSRQQQCILPQDDLAADAA